MSLALLAMCLRWRWGACWGKIGEGKKLSAEDVLVLYLGTIADKLEGDVCRNRQT